MHFLDGESMECIFDEITTTGKVITRYHSIDFLNDKGKRHNGTIQFHYGSKNVISVLDEKYRCYQSVDQLCQPWVQELYDIDKNGTGGHNRRCQCLRWIKSFDSNNG